MSEMVIRLYNNIPNDSVLIWCETKEILHQDILHNYQTIYRSSVQMLIRDFTNSAVHTSNLYLSSPSESWQLSS